MAIAKLIKDNFDYMKVVELPAAAGDWRRDKITRLRLFSDTGGPSTITRLTRHDAPSGLLSKRLKAIHRVLVKDNGDASGPRFVHWCVGATCCPHGADEALGCMVDAYIDLFAFMPVPLLYRWKHAPVANNFVRDGVFLQCNSTPCAGNLADREMHFGLNLVWA